MSLSLGTWPKLYRGVLLVLMFVVSYSLLIKRIFEDLDDIIGIVIRPQAGTSRNRGSIPGKERCSSLLHSAQTGS